MDLPFDLSHRPAAGLTTGQLGRYGEDLACLLLGRMGYDVYRAAVDDKGIDLVIRYPDGHHADVQVKAIRPRGKSYNMFLEKEKFAPGPNLHLVFVVCEEAHDTVYFIPSEVWLNPDRDRFVSRDYGEGRKSKPEWGLNWSERRRPQFEEFRVATVSVGGREG
jgi:hypothetical protein